MTRLARMRTPLVACTLAALLGLSACGLGSDSVSAATREQTAIDAVTEGLPLALTALEGTEALADGQWTSCPGGIGHQFRGGGILTAPKGEVGAQLEAVRTALIGADFQDDTTVDGHVSLTREEVSLDIQQPSSLLGPKKWRVSYHGPCRTYSGEDETYVEQQSLAPAETLLP